MKAAKALHGVEGTFPWVDLPSDNVLVFLEKTN